jgi:hypothetical protein
VPIPQAGDHLNPVACYLGDNAEKYITHPYASPIFGDFKGLPPMLIQSGDAEVLRDEITLIAHKATLAGVKIEHELYEDAVHVFQFFPFLTATRKAFHSTRHFVKQTLPLYQSRSPRVLDDKTEADLEHEMDMDRSCIVDGDGSEVAAGRLAAQELAEEDSSDDTSSSRTTSRTPSINGDSGDETTPVDEPTHPSRTTSGSDSSWMRSPSLRMEGLQNPAQHSWQLEDAVQSAGTSVDLDSQDTSTVSLGSSFLGLSTESSESRQSQPVTRPPLSRSSTAKPPLNPSSRRERLPLADFDSPSPSFADINTNTTPTSPDSPRPIRRQYSRSGPNSPVQSKRSLSRPKMTMTPMTASLIIPTAPSIRQRARTTSHPDMVELCKSWSDNGPANQTKTYHP